MLLVVSSVLLVLWVLGVVTAWTFGGFIHILLVLALTLLVVQFTMGHHEA